MLPDLVKKCANRVQKAHRPPRRSRTAPKPPRKDVKMPSGKKDIYGNPSKALYKAGTIRAERAAAANRDPERARRAMQRVAQEGITRRPEVIRTTTAMKPTPMGKKK